MKRSISMAPLVQANVEQLNLLKEVVTPLNEQTYQRDMTGSGVLGSHVRHVLDHYHALCLAMEEDTGMLDYERRERGRACETDSKAALEEIELVQARFEIMRQRIKHVNNVALTLIENEEPVAVTSVSRELSFLYSHTVHHLAIIRLMLQSFGENTDPRLGVHPSTLRSRENVCAP